MIRRNLIGVLELQPVPALHGFVVDCHHQDPKEDLQGEEVHVTHLRAAA